MPRAVEQLRRGRRSSVCNTRPARGNTASGSERQLERDQVPARTARACGPAEQRHRRRQPTGAAPAKHAALPIGQDDRQPAAPAGASEVRRA